MNIFSNELPGLHKEI